MKNYFEKLYKNKVVDFYKIVDSNLQNQRKMFIITANPETFIYGNNNPNFSKILLNKDTTLIPDGISIVKGAKALNYPIVERITGIDLVNHLLEICEKENYKLSLLGAREEVLNKLVKVIKEKYPHIKLGTCMNGYTDDKDKFFEKAKKESPDICLVALGIPFQETIIYKHFNEFKKGIFIGVGGSFDVLSGFKKRAPKIFQKLNIEWLYRIIKEPKRLKRFYKNNIQFVFQLKKIKKGK